MRAFFVLQTMFRLSLEFFCWCANLFRCDVGPAV